MVITLVSKDIISKEAVSCFSEEFLDIWLNVLAGNKLRQNNDTRVCLLASIVKFLSRQ